MQPRASPAKFPTFQSLEEAKESKAMEIMKGMALYTDIITVPTTTPWEDQVHLLSPFPKAICDVKWVSFLTCQILFYLC